MMVFCLKRHDRLPAITYVVTDNEGLPLDLTPYTAVRFFMRQRDHTELKVSGNASFDGDKQDGIVRYEWADGDTDTAGVFFAEFELEDASGKKRSVPSTGLIRIEIAGDLDDA